MEVVQTVRYTPGIMLKEISSPALLQNSKLAQLIPEDMLGQAINGRIASVITCLLYLVHKTMFKYSSQRQCQTSVAKPCPLPTINPNASKNNERSSQEDALDGTDGLQQDTPFLRNLFVILRSVSEPMHKHDNTWATSKESVPRVNSSGMAYTILVM